MAKPKELTLRQALRKIKRLEKKVENDKNHIEFLTNENSDLINKHNHWGQKYENQLKISQELGNENTELYQTVAKRNAHIEELESGVIGLIKTFNKEN